MSEGCVCVWGGDGMEQVMKITDYLEDLSPLGEEGDGFGEAWEAKAVEGDEGTENGGNTLLVVGLHVIKCDQDPDIREMERGWMSGWVKREREREREKERASESVCVFWGVREDWKAGSV